MWGIRTLSGQQAGQVFPLKDGRNIVGRGPQCQIRFNDNDISKEHALILVDQQQLTIVDNQSRNGTFVNGVMVNKAPLRRGDKISFNQVICDIIQFPSHQLNNSNGNLTVDAQGKSLGNTFNNNISTLNNHSHQPINSPHRPQSGENQSFIQKYFEEVFMPGIYNLGKVMEFKLVIGLFMFIFAVLVTALSTIPMIAITSDSIQIESRRRALTIARNLANINQTALLKEMESSLSTQSADLEEGVTHAFIIRQSDGTVIAPAIKAGTIPNFPFIEVARRDQKEVVKQIDSSHIAVAVPLSAFNPETASYAVKAFAVVIYDMGALAVDDGRTLSLFFQTLIIALILGFCLYYLFYRFIEYPILNLNNQIDLILKGSNPPTASIDLEFPAMGNLVSNVNTLLTRMSNPEDQNSGFGHNKDLEVLNIIRMVGYAGIAITADFNILGINQAAEHLLGLSDSQLKNQPITLIPDQALQKNLYDLIDQANKDPSTPSKNELEFGGENTEINCISITEKGKNGFYLVTIIPLGGS